MAHFFLMRSYFLRMFSLFFWRGYPDFFAWKIRAETEKAITDFEMKKFALFFLLFAIAPIFAESNYALGGFSLAFDVQEEEKMYDYSMPLTLGGFLELNHFGENCYGNEKNVGFQTGVFFNFGVNDDNDEHVSTLCLSTHFSPVFLVKLKNEKMLFLSAGIAAGIDFGGYWTDGEENEAKDVTVFQAFAGPCTQATMVLSGDFSFGANFFYNPLCYTKINVKGEGKENGVHSFGNMFRVGIFIGFCMRD